MATDIGCERVAYRDPLRRFALATPGSEPVNLIIPIKLSRSGMARSVTPTLTRDFDTARSNAAQRWLEHRGTRVTRSLAGNFTTSLEMAGA